MQSRGKGPAKWGKRINLQNRGKDLTYKVEDKD